MEISKRIKRVAVCTSIFGAAVAIAMTASTPSFAQVKLSTYADSEGYIDVQKLTCAQLANTWQQDADLLAVWYSGWYNGLAKAHRAKISRIKDDEHEVIVYCKANPDKKIIEAIDTIFKSKK